MELKGKNSMFKEMLKVASVDGLFPELVINIDKNGVIVQASGGPSKISIAVRFIGTGFEKIECGDKPFPFGIKLSKIVGKLKFFGDDEDITWTDDGSDLVIAGDQYVFITTMLDPTAIDSNKFVVPIDEEKKVALYKKGKMEPTTIANVQASVLQAISNVSNEVGMEYFPIVIKPPHIVECDVGNRKRDKTNDIGKYKSKPEDVYVDGEEISTSLGHGFREVCSVIDGEVQVSGIPESVFKKPAPLWIYSQKEDYEVGFFLAPKMEKKSKNEKKSKKDKK